MNKFEQLRDRLAEQIGKQRDIAYREFGVGQRPYDSVSVPKDQIWGMYSTATPEKRQQMWDSWDSGTKKQFRGDFGERLQEQEE